MRNSTIRDNHNKGAVGDFLEETIKPDSEVSIVSAYFTIYAYHQLKGNLEKIKNLRFLFGEPTFIKSLDPTKVNPRQYQIEDDSLSIPLESRLEQKRVSRECADWIKSKTEIRSMVKPNFLHGKLYHVIHPGGVEKAIAGSSNFTVKGLGMNKSKNIELNLVIDSDNCRQELKEWFDEIWNDKTGLVEDVKESVLAYLEQLYIDNDPEFIYYKTLFHIFEKYLDEQEKGGLFDEKIGILDTKIWNMLYDFQKVGVKGAINKISKHNGCIIADSVGLGKTFEALAIIKYFELKRLKVLIICPKKLEGIWTIYQANQNHILNPFASDGFSYQVLFHTDMGRTSGKSSANGLDLQNFDWGAYDLVVIDESHNFRGNPTEKVKANGDVKMNRAKWLMEKIIKSGSKTKVLMLSATPVNNTLRDLRNQIAFITEGKKDALKESCNIKDIDLTLKIAQSQFTSWADIKSNPNRSQKQLLEKLDTAFFKILDELTIARSRKHIKTYFPSESVGKFPERNKPFSVYPEIDLQRRFPSYDRINKQILEYSLSVFNPSAYIKPEKQDYYEAKAASRVITFTQKQRERILIEMMKVNFLKRLESSIKSFEISMDRTIKKIELLETKIREFLNLPKKSQEESLELLVPDEEEWEENGDDNDQWLVGKKFKFDLADLELDRWLVDLENDRDALLGLLNNAIVVTPERDAKLDTLKSLICQKVEFPINGNNKKVLIFTAFADTARYIFDNIKDWCKSDLELNCALVSGSETQTSFGKNDYDSILTNFSPISKKRSQMNCTEKEGEIDILIATDCISEGQNLQDCDYLVNYDIHWNPVRIIQRFGRIDRLGSINERIQLVNFWPTKDLDKYINLKSRVEARMALVDVTATGDDDILNTDQLHDLITSELHFRHHQLKKLQEEILDLEDMDEMVSLTDFTMDDFRIELLEFIKNNQKRLAEAPLGLYASVPAPAGEFADLHEGRIFSESEKDIIKSGVIYCLKQKCNYDENEEINPLNPYFLVYVRDDGMIRYNYTHSKQILEVFRLLCQNIQSPYESLCHLFNKETEKGENMEKYSGLLKKAVEEITRVFKQRGNRRLTSDRGGRLIPLDMQINEMNDFELVTWLIVR